MRGAERLALVRVRDGQRDEPGCARGGNSRRRVLDRQHLVRVDEPGGQRRRRVEHVDSQLIPLGARLPFPHVLRRDDRLEQVAYAFLAEGALDLLAQRSTDDAEEEPRRRRLPHELARSGEEHVAGAVHRLLVVARLARDQPREPVGRHRLPRLVERLGERLPVAPSEESRPGLLAGQRHPFLAEDAQQQLMVQGLVVDEHAVEVEQQGAEHGGMIDPLGFDEPPGFARFDRGARTG
jgi:hypothetical protein